jgi:hypothetical protein
MVITINKTQAQISDWGNLYIFDNGQMHVVSGAYTFQSPLTGSQTATTRTASYGKLSFDNSINTTTGSGTARFVDGYVRKYGVLPLVYPLGNGTTFAPAKITPTAIDGVDAAFYFSNPTSSPRTSALNPTLSSVSTTEYWHILRGSGTPNASISLSWRSGSAISTLTSGSLSSLTIAGWNGSQWVTISSNFDTTNVFDATTTTLTAGSITSSASVDLGTFQYFTFASKAACAPLVAVVPANATTWNGTTWSNGVPTLDAPVTLTGNFSGNLSCNTLAINSGVTLTLANGELLEVVNGITGSGKVIMSSQASLVQRINAAGTANIELTKVSRPMHWRDYMYYGTPIAGNFISQLTTNTWNDALPVNGGSFDINDPNGYGGPWRYVVGGGGWNALNDATGIVTGKGFIARIRGNMPWNGGNNTAAPSPAVTPGATGVVNFKFAGVANNGDVVVPVTVSATQFELLANPYPSAVDAQKFLSGNTNLDGALYFWTANTPRLGTGTTQTYATTGDYALWTLAGATNTSPISLKPDGKIASAQGFRVRAKTAGATATFTNCMRLTTGNNTFFRQAAAPKVDRYSLTIEDNSNSDLYNQIVVAYIPEATLDYDRMYDAPKYSTSGLQIYTLMNDNSKLGIDARPSFVDTDIVPLGFSNTSAEQSFTIKIENKEGIFNSNNVYVYIHDLLDNTYHDLNTPYTFTSNNESLLNNRFKIVYQSSALHNTDFLTNSVIINIKNNIFSASTNEIGISSVEIFDITGRKIESFDAYNKTVLSESFIHAEGIYIAKVKLVNGSIATQKLINKK